MVLPPRLPDIPNLWPFARLVGGQIYPLQTLLGEDEPIDAGFAGYVTGMFKASPAVFACEMVRLNLFSEARFMWRRLNSGRPGDLFTSRALRILDHPWPKATTGDLLVRMLVHADFGGTSFVVRRPNAFRPLRPDWVVVLLGSEQDPEMAAADVDADIIGLGYYPGGPSGGQKPQLFLTEEFAVFASTPDPTAPAGLGMPWVQTVVREVMGHQAAAAHKLRYFKGGMTPNMVISVDPKYTDPQIESLRKQIETRHEGTRNAYRTLVLRAGMEKIDKVGAELAQDFKVIQGASETLVAAAAGVGPVIAMLSEGLQGSSLNAGNFDSAMRRVANITARPLWRNVAGSLEAIIPPPTTADGGGSPCQLWYDDRDIPALKEDIKDAAEVRNQNATAMRTLRDGGWKPDAVVKAVTSGDMTLLVGEHDGTKPVQQQPGTGTPDQSNPMPGDAMPSTNGQKPAMPTGGIPT